MILMIEIMKINDDDDDDDHTLCSNIQIPP